jgi:hypothetical protein
LLVFVIVVVIDHSCALIIILSIYLCIYLSSQYIIYHSALSALSATWHIMCGCWYGCIVVVVVVGEYDDALVVIL